MRQVIINEPIWKNNSVGIDENKIDSEGVFVMISYKDKRGSLKYPNQYYVSRQLADKCETMKKKNTPTLRIIPINEMEEI